MTTRDDIVTFKPAPPIGVAQAVELVVGKLHEIKKVNDDMQALVVVGSRAWHRYETIDDRIFEALQLLGE